MSLFPEKPKGWDGDVSRIAPRYRSFWQKVAFCYPIFESFGSLIDVGPHGRDAALDAGTDLGDDGYLTSVGFGKGLDGTSNAFYNMGDWADFEFLHDKSWSVACMFSLRDTAADESMLIGKFGTGQKGQFRMYVERGTAPQNLQIERNGSNKGSFIAIETDQVYLVVVSNSPNDAQGSKGRMWSTCLNVDTGELLGWRFPVSGATDANQLTADLTFGGVGPGDEMDGALLFVAGWFRNLTVNEHVLLHQDPWGMFRQVDTRGGIVPVAPSVLFRDPMRAGGVVPWARPV